MQNADVVLGVLRDRGEKGLPLERLYRQLFNEQLFLSDCSACGRDPDVSAGEFGEDVEGPAAVLGRGG